MRVEGVEEMFLDSVVWEETLDVSLIMFVKRPEGKVSVREVTDKS
jgi:hypothetical protein